MSYIATFRDIRWHYLLCGQGSPCTITVQGEPLVFLHGWGVDMRLWRQQTEYFSSQYPVMTIDLPGHGQTAWQDLSFEEMTRDLNGILETLGFQGITVVGSSLGGLIALKLWELFPARIRRMVWVGCLPKFSQSDDYPFGLRTEWIAKLNRQIETDYPAILHIFFRSLFTRKERETPRFQWLKQFRRSEGLPLKEALQAFLTILEKEDLREVFSKIRIPFGMMNGTDDYICSKEAANFLQRQLPRARVDFFENCGHFPFLTKPQEFNEALEEFLMST